MKKGAIYTAIIGKGYDLVHQPKHVDENYDYILFSDELPIGRDGVWEIRRLNYCHVIPIKTARYVKTHPHELLPEYEITIWIDANVIIQKSEFYHRVEELYQSNVDFSTMWHSCDGIYEAMLIILCNHWENEDVIIRWGQYLRKHNYPRHNGLHETNVIYRLNNGITKQFNETWWNFINMYSRRDQFSFDYVLWKSILRYENFLPDETNTRNSDIFYVPDHKNDKIKDVASTYGNVFVQYLALRRDRLNEIVDTYVRIFDTSCPFILRIWYGLYYRLRNISIIIRRVIRNKLKNKYL